MTGIASAATSVVIAHVAAGTSRIRLGAGGIMLPNHAPLVIAEQFGTLATLHPGRIDLGLGRAPGTDQLTARALREVEAVAQCAGRIAAFDDGGEIENRQWNHERHHAPGAATARPRWYGVSPIARAPSLQT